MNKWIALSIVLLISKSVLGEDINDDKKRAQEVKTQMWGNTDKDFAVTQVPEKWLKEDAVILAKSNTLFYRKEVIVANLYYDSYSHQRIKLLSQKAIEEYAQFKLDGGSSSGGIRVDVYAGFKIVKPDGKEIEVPISEAVKKTESFNSYEREIFMLAVPNLNIGDIVDFYIVRERKIILGRSKYYSFDPLIFQLSGEHPIVKQKISFEVLRRCYINLKSLNGAPQFKLRQDEKDKSYYYLEDQNRESVKNVRWLMPYRELPTVKFKVTYASSYAAGVVPGFIGDPGVIKSQVSAGEITALVAFYFRYVAYQQSNVAFKTYMKKHYKSEKNPEKLAKAAFYALRNIKLVSMAEQSLLTGSDLPANSNITMIILSDYFRSKKISHEFLIGVPRHVSALNDMIFENEISMMIKINTPKPFYISRFDIDAIPGEIESEMQGEEVYSGMGIGTPNKWNLRKVKVPLVDAQQSNITSDYGITITDLNQGEAKLTARKTATGLSRIGYQNDFVDYYSFNEEEKKMFDMKDSKFSDKMEKRRTDYKANRAEQFKTKLKQSVLDDFEFTVEDVTGPSVEQAGRFEEKPDFIMSYEASIKGMVKRAGPNYLVDIGKFIEGQTKIGDDEKDRKYNVYIQMARSFNYHIELTIPDGYSVGGVEKLNTSVKNDTGEFTSTAKVDGNKLVISTSKVYKVNYAPKTDWPNMIGFLDAAYAFTNMQVVLEKK